MVMLSEQDILTKEVLEWKGLHLFHFRGSTCSQKTRIFLRLKGIDWESHHMNLIKKVHLTPWYMGINPRGLVPTLVHDGKVIIESNDILEYLEAQFPEPALISQDKHDEVHAMLKAEDDLHLDIRALTMRFVFPSFLAKRPKSDIDSYQIHGSGTVGGQEDAHRKAEIKFWSDLSRHGTITDEQSQRAFYNFRKQLDDFERQLADQEFLLGDAVSLVDIAWYIYGRRLISASYPLHRLHPAVGRWFDRLNKTPNFRDEVPAGGLIGAITSMLHFKQRISRTRLEDVVGKLA